MDSVVVSVAVTLIGALMYDLVLDEVPYWGKAVICAGLLVFLAVFVYRSAKGRLGLVRTRQPHSIRRILVGVVALLGGLWALAFGLRGISSRKYVIAHRIGPDGNVQAFTVLEAPLMDQVWLWLGGAGLMLIGAALLEVWSSTKGAGMPRALGLLSGGVGLLLCGVSTIAGDGDVIGGVGLLLGGVGLLLGSGWCRSASPRPADATAENPAIAATRDDLDPSDSGV